MGYLNTKYSKADKKLNYVEIAPSKSLSETKNEYFYIDRPKTPKYVPMDPKIDKTTQIERRDWHLFDFNEEVEPLLQVIIPKILEQSKFEIIWENSVQRRQRENHNYELIRNARIHKVQRGLYRQKRKLQENKIRTKQNELSLVDINAVHRKLLARNFSKKIIMSLSNRSEKIVKHNILLDFDEGVILENDLLCHYVRNVDEGNARSLSVQNLFKSVINKKTGDKISKHKEAIKAHEIKLKEEEIRKQEEKENLKRILKEKKRLRALKKLSKQKKTKFEEIIKKIEPISKNVKPFNLWNNKIFELSDFDFVDKNNANYIGMVFNPLFYILIILENFTDDFEKNFNSILPHFIGSFKGDLVLPVNKQIMDLYNKTSEQTGLDTITFPTNEEIQSLIDQILQSDYLSFFIKNEIIQEETFKVVYSFVLNKKFKSLNAEMSNKELGDSNSQKEEEVQKSSSNVSLNNDRAMDKIIIKVKEPMLEEIKNNIKLIIFTREKFSDKKKENLDEEEFLTYSENVKYEQYKGDEFFKKLMFFEKSEEKINLKSFNTNKTASFIFSCIARMSFVQEFHTSMNRFTKEDRLDDVIAFLDFWEMKYITCLIEGKEEICLHDY